MRENLSCFISFSARARVNNVLIEVLVQEPRTEWALTDQFNLGGNFSLRKDLFLDWRTGVIGRPGDSIFDREARFSHDLTVGWNRGPWSLRATAMNVTGADYLRDRRTGTIPDLDPRFLLLAGYRWEF